MSDKSVELEILKKRATELGINFGAQIGVESLRERIEQHTSELAEGEPSTVAGQTEAPKMSAKEAREYKRINEATAETENQRKARLRREASKMVRVVVTCYDPKKRNHTGDFFTVSNSAIGSFRRYIPYGNENGWHVEQAFVEMIREKDMQTFDVTSDSRGNQIRKARLSKAYHVQILPSLTEEELRDLKQRQAMAAGSAS